MVETLTRNYGWVKPEIQGSPSTWGGFLNTDLDSIDALVWANQQGINPVGSIMMFGGVTAPTNWLICNGASLSTTTYALLFAAIGYNFGGAGANFNLPNFGVAFPIGAGAGQGTGAVVGETGGSMTVTLSTAQLPPHAHPIVDVAHDHSVNQWAHSHAIATGGHSHTISTGGHSHPNVLVTSGVSGGVPAGVGIVGNVTSVSAGDLGGSASFVGNLGGNTDAQTSAVSLNASGTNLSTTQNTGSGQPVPTLPPFVGVNFIIRYQ